MIPKALDDMPVEYRDRFAELLARPALDGPALAAELDQYLAAVNQLRALSTTIDLDTAERLADALAALLRGAEGYGPDARRLVQAAVEYFVREEDDEEITGVLGFDDDVQVINAVVRALGRPDLVVPFRRVDL